MKRQAIVLSFIVAGCLLIGVSTAKASSHASSSDLAEGRKFLSQLPPACGSSSMYTQSDGTVVILIECSGNGQEMSGMVKIKNGVVREVR